MEGGERGTWMHLPGFWGQPLCLPHTWVQRVSQARPLVAFAPSLSKGGGGALGPQEGLPYDNPLLPQLSPGSQYRLVGGPHFPHPRLPVLSLGPPLPDLPMSGKEHVKALLHRQPRVLLQSLSSLDRLFDILMSSPWLPLCNLSPVVLLALYRGGSPSSFFVQPFPVARRLIGEPTPLVVRLCPHQLQLPGVTPLQLASCIPLSSLSGVWVHGAEPHQPLECTHGSCQGRQKQGPPPTRPLFRT